MRDGGRTYQLHSPHFHIKSSRGGDTVVIRRGQSAEPDTVSDTEYNLCNNKSTDRIDELGQNLLARSANHSGCEIILDRKGPHCQCA